MAKRLKDAGDPGQDGAWAHRSSKEKYKEAAQKLFAWTTPKEHSSSAFTLADVSGGPSEADTAPLEDVVGSPREIQRVLLRTFLPCCLCHL